MSDCWTSGRAGQTRSRFWRGGGRRQASGDQKLTLEILETRATVSDVFLSLLWSSSAAIIIADPLSGAEGGDGAAIHRRAAETGLVATPEEAGAGGQCSPGGWGGAGDHAPLAPTESSSPTVVAVASDALPVATELALALARPRPPAHPPVQSGSLAGAGSSSGSVDEGGSASGNPFGPGVIASGASSLSVAPTTFVAPTILPSKGDGHSPPPRAKGFKVSWLAGETDDAGNLTGGTELMNLVGHDGKLYAGTSVWKDAPGNDPVVGAQVLRLDSPRGRWQVDLNLSELMDDGTARYLRISALTSVTFTTDGQGQPLSPPVSMLLAAPADNAGTLSVFSRDDATGAWTEMDLYAAGTPAGFRSFGFHHDTVTSVDHVFAGAGIFGIFNGVYDASVPGRIRWNSIPQLIRQNRPMAFAEIDNVLYVAIDPGIYARTDGVLAHWEMVYQFTDPPYPNDGLRGLTAVPNPSGEGDVLLGSLEGYQGYIGYVDPAAGFTSTEELYFVPYFIRQWGRLVNLNVVAGYNDMTPLQDPHTGEPLELIGLGARNPSPDHANSAWYLVRHLDGSYDLHEIPPLATPENPTPDLFGTRAIAISPFPEDRGKKVYFGGYDVSSDSADHNTAWIYRASLATVLGG